MINQLEKIALNIFVIHSDRTGVIRNTSLQFFGSKKREREKEKKPIDVLETVTKI